MGAMMISIDDRHPDLLDFITRKLDLDAVTKANISVKFSDAFFKAVENDDFWEMSFTRKKTGEVISKKVKAVHILRTFADCNWRTGEPGMLFWDNMKRYHFLQFDPTFELETVNPCFTGDTLVAVADGRERVPFRVLAEEGKDVPVYTMDDDGNPCVRFMRHPRKTGNSVDIVKVTLDNGKFIRCTPNHKFYLLDGRKVEAKDLVSGDSLNMLFRSRSNHTDAFWHTSGKDTHQEDYNIIGTSRSKKTSTGKRYHDFEHRMIYYHYHPESIPEVKMVIHHKNFNELDNYPSNLECITSSEPITKVGFNNLVLEYSKPSNHKIVSVEPAGKEDVYNGMVDDFHTYFVGGFDDSDITGSYCDSYCLVSNCAELPLPKYGACLLGSINLSEFVRLPFTSDAVFMVNEFKECVKQAVIYLNRVLDINTDLHPLQQQRDMSRNYRPIGLGVTGYADMLLKMLSSYSKSKKISEDISVAFRDAGISASIDLAKEYGAYPKYNAFAVTKSDYFSNLPANLREGISKHGLRNSHLFAIAPTGTISSFLGCSYGIEPHYALSYRMKTESLHNDHHEWYDVDLDIIKEMKKVNPEYLLLNSVDTALTMNYKDRIEIQSIWQKVIDSGISSTINLNENATVEDIMNIYVEANRSGLKGVTVFRENCFREGVLDAGKEKQEESQDKKTKTREDYGKILSGTTQLMNAACGKLYITLNKDESGNLVECFITSSKNKTCKSNLDAVARLTSLCLRSGVSVDEVSKQLKSIVCLACTRNGKVVDGLSCPDLVAKAMIESVQGVNKENTVSVKELDKVNVFLGDEISSKTVCPECDSGMIMTGGCSTCSTCGYSKCN